MIILGINAYHPDSSAAIVADGRLIAACEEERFNRIKHFAGLPVNSISYCLKEAGISIKAVDFIAIPRCLRARILKKMSYGLKIPSLLTHRLGTLRDISYIRLQLAEHFDIESAKISAKIIEVEHHRAHLASSFFVSDYDKALLVSMDAMGDFASAMWAAGQGSNIKVLGEITFPHSLGFYYTALTQFLGFTDFGDEYKVMGLASYGEPLFEEEFKKILKICGKKIELGLEYFLHHRKYIDMNFEKGSPSIEPIFSSSLEKLLGEKRRRGEPIEKRHKDIAFCMQKRLEDAIINFLNSMPGNDRSDLCISGGVFHNCAANAKIPERTLFKRIFIPPAPGDAGLAVGAAFYLWNRVFGKPRGFKMKHAYWGPGFEEKEIEVELNSRYNELRNKGYGTERIDDEEVLCERIAGEIEKGKIVGWFQGRMEFGPRALGNRSILADPRNESIRDVLNRRVKHRESFRPFAPSILEECVGDYFESSRGSPFMAFADKIREDKKVTVMAACHVDGTARLQTVNSGTNPLYWKLIKKFYDITGVPMLINTSFNDNEPIVCSPKEAIDCLLRTKIDLLVLGRHMIGRDGNA